MSIEVIDGVVQPTSPEVVEVVDGVVTGSHDATPEVEEEDTKEEVVAPVEEVVAPEVEEEDTETPAVDVLSDVEPA